jgi:cell division protein FtsW (lipid II flippase)
MNMIELLKEVPYFRTRIAAFKTYRQPDWILVAVIGVLLAVGAMSVYTTTVFPVVSGRLDIPANAFASQMRAMALGLVVFMVLASLDYGVYRLISVPLAMACMAALIVARCSTAASRHPKSPKSRW